MTGSWLLAFYKKSFVKYVAFYHILLYNDCNSNLFSLVRLPKNFFKGRGQTTAEKGIFQVLSNFVAKFSHEKYRQYSMQD